MVTTFIFASSDTFGSQRRCRCCHHRHYVCFCVRDGQGASQLHRIRLVWTHASLRGCLHLLRQRHQTCRSLLARHQLSGQVGLRPCLHDCLSPTSGHVLRLSQGLVHRRLQHFAGVSDHGHGHPLQVQVCNPAVRWLALHCHCSLYAHWFSCHFIHFISQLFTDKYLNHIINCSTMITFYGHQ